MEFYQALDNWVTGSTQHITVEIKTITTTNKDISLFYLSMIHYNCNIFKLWYQTIHLDNFHLLLPSVPNSRDQWVLLRNPTE